MNNKMTCCEVANSLLYVPVLCFDVAQSLYLLNGKKLQRCTK